MTVPGAVTQAAGQPSTVRVGTIVSVSPVRVNVQGTVFSGESVGVLGSYSPVVGDHVSVLGQSVRGASSSGSSWLILGRVSGSRPLAAGTMVAKLARTSATTIGNNVNIPWDTVTRDDLGGFDAALPTRYTPRVAGWWQFTVRARQPAMGGGASLSGLIKVNGVSLGVVHYAANASPSAGNGYVFTDATAFNGTTDYVEIEVGNSAGTAINAAGSIFMATYVGATP